MIATLVLTVFLGEEPGDQLVLRVRAIPRVVSDASILRVAHVASRPFEGFGQFARLFDRDTPVQIDTADPTVSWVTPAAGAVSGGGGS